MDANLDTFHKASLFMVTAEGTDRVDDLVHFLQRHSVHLPVQFVKVFLDLLIIVGIVLVVALVEHG